MAERFAGPVTTPQHDKIILGQSAAVVQAGGDTVVVTGGVLDDNDAIRLAAFLNRWFRERHMTGIRAEANRVKASRAAKAKRNNDRRTPEVTA